MNRTLLKCVPIAGLVALLLNVILWVQATRVPTADYESEYARADPPAYHATPVKRAISLISPDGADLVSQRRAAAPIRLLGLMAFWLLCRRHFGEGAALWTLGIFLVLPPTFPYLSRLDSWMDSVSFIFVSLYFMSMGRTDRPAASSAWNFFSGALAALALDSKLTAAVTLIPAGLIFFWKMPRTCAICFIIGAAVGFAAAQPEWIIHPTETMAHVTYWKASNTALPTLPPQYAVTAIWSAVPLSLWCLLGVACYGAPRGKTMFAAGFLGLVPVFFFTFYRTLDPDGIRHFFMALPCAAALAGFGLNRLPRTFKFCFVAVCAMELFLRDFPKF